MSTIKDPIWINDSVAAQVDHNLLEGIEEDLEKYAKAVERALPALPVEDGTVRLQELWIETALPYDLLETLLKRHRLHWPANVRRIQLRNEVLPRPEEEDTPGP